MVVRLDVLYITKLLNLGFISNLSIDLNIEDKDGWTPLHHAARNGSLKAIEFLLDNGVDDSHFNKHREAAIHTAVMHNQLKVLDVRKSTFFLLFVQYIGIFLFDM